MKAQPKRVGKPRPGDPVTLERLKSRWARRGDINPKQFMATRLTLVGCDLATVGRHMGITDREVCNLLTETEAIFRGVIQRPSRPQSAEKRREELAAIYDEEAIVEICSYCHMRWHNADNCISREHDSLRSCIGSALGAAA